MLRFVSFNLHTLTTTGRKRRFCFSEIIMWCLRARRLPPLNYYMKNYKLLWGSPLQSFTALLAEPIKYSNPAPASSTLVRKIDTFCVTCRT